MAEETPYTLSGRTVKRLLDVAKYAESIKRNNRPRRRRHVHIGAGGSDIVMIRFEEELRRGMAANARIVDPATLLTVAGPQIVAMDDEKKWFARGAIAPSGDDGGDPKGDANLGFAIKTGEMEGELYVYSIISCGTWFRYISGTLLGDVWEVNAEDVSGHDGEWPRSDAGTAMGVITLNALGCLEAAYGVEFRAIFNEISRRYDVWAACCPE